MSTNLDKANQDLLLEAHTIWMNESTTLTFLSNLERSRQQLISDAEQYAATPTDKAKEQMQICLNMARAYKLILEFSKKHECIIRSL